MSKAGFSVIVIPLELIIHLIAVGVGKKWGRHSQCDIPFVACFIPDLYSLISFSLLIVQISYFLLTENLV